MPLSESLQRFRDAGLTLARSPTRLAPGAGVIAKNCRIGQEGSIVSRPGYRRWMEVSMAAPVFFAGSFGDKVLIVAGNVDEEANA